MRRMDRYDNQENTHLSRYNKNKDLYDKVSSDNIYTNISDVINANAFEIPNSNNLSRTNRETYQKLKKYQDIESLPQTKKELEDFNFIYQKRENKVYDINSVLEQARKNRTETDDKEEKRKLKDDKYNILAGLTQEKLEEYRKERKNKVVNTPDEIRELIDTIASKTLAGEIDKATSVNLLSDLMATNMLDKVSSIEDIDSDDNISKEVLNATQVNKIKKLDQNSEVVSSNLKEKDNDFYTRSMDLSDKDFDLGDDFVEKKLPLPLKIFIFLLIISLIGVSVYFIFNKLS